MDAGLQRIQDTWDELDCKLRARGFWLFIRTEPHADKIGSIHLPPRLASFHGELPHMRYVTACVLSAGNQGVAKQFTAGDRVVFQRLHFGYWKKCEDGTYVGWIDSNQVIGFADEGTYFSPFAPSIA